ncbi:hypothetical protein [Asanoa siamensis]|uniref:Uncharacterized protein n=1 Tax=Asanoa siamensis TaxID=926357 RepID=A0ABQ4CWJ1_9ACTN|nr:hypothetical protein [Asanoa siamensis]GIF75645.1 hypothetical protein Asi02nite_51630 [Asanoa siamensis]
MPTDLTEWTLTVASVTLPIVALWLRLWFRGAPHRERRRYLSAAAALPAGTRVTDHHPDGTPVTITDGGTGRRSR